MITIAMKGQPRPCLENYPTVDQKGNSREIRDKDGHLYVHRGPRSIFSRDARRLVEQAKGSEAVVAAFSVSLSNAYRGKNGDCLDSKVIEAVVATAPLCRKLRLSKIATMGDVSALRSYARCLGAVKQHSAPSVSIDPIKSTVEFNLDKPSSEQRDFQFLARVAARIGGPITVEAAWNAELTRPEAPVAKKFERSMTTVASPISATFAATPLVGQPPVNEADSVRIHSAPQQQALTQTTPPAVAEPEPQAVQLYMAPSQQAQAHGTAAPAAMPPSAYEHSARLAAMCGQGVGLTKLIKALTCLTSTGELALTQERQLELIKAAEDHPEILRDPEGRRPLLSTFEGRRLFMRGADYLAKNMTDTAGRALRMACGGDQLTKFGFEPERPAIASRPATAADKAAT